MEASLGARTTDDWRERFPVAGIAAGRDARVDDLVDDPQLRTVGVFEIVRHLSGGELVQDATPVVFDGDRPHVRAPAPRLGKHTEEVLRDVGNRRPEATEAGLERGRRPGSARNARLVSGPG